MGQIWHIFCEEAEQKIRNMKATAGLLVLLLTVCHAEEKACDGRKDGVQCYGKLGEPMLLRLMDNANALFRYTWKKNKTVLLAGGNGRKVNLTERRFSFTPEEGLMKIEKLERRDGDKYTLIIYNDRGRQISSRTLQLFVEAPVISVQIASKCLPQGEQQVSCSAEGGDNPKYEWTLDGKPLPLTELPGRFQANITLTKHQSGQLRCSVRNNVSHVREETRIWTCVFINCTSNGTRISQWLPETKRSLCDEQIKGIGAPQSKTFLPIMGGVLSALFLLLVVAVAIVLSQKKKQSDTREEEQDLTYADVRILTQPQQQMKGRQEVAVEYGQVNFSQRPRSTIKLEQDGCVYANVNRGR
ncbi:platelet-derived growth factor receptor alpha-like isoform X2 [Nerophis ophidion]|uniref:platelet-derived growth factor receptor alpha-like isoform X2 n=1 Tax=Nerophis ophidion TaxID=159077 RepID=UPI002AE01638|nr:platelet-derived growth factor receptor alpha-like isoform X2 [Nerophis ophidion]